MDATDNEALLKQWKEQLERDVNHKNEIELSGEEWLLVEEGLADYEKGEVITLEEFIKKR